MPYRGFLLHDPNGFIREFRLKPFEFLEDFVYGTHTASNTL